MKLHLLKLLVPLAAASAMVVGGVTIASSQSKSLQGDGYVLSPVTDYAEDVDLGSLTPDQIYFTAGTGYKVKFPDQAVFKDIQKNVRRVESDSFIHYADGSVASISDGVLVNMDEVRQGVINHYAMTSGTVLSNDGTSFAVEQNGSALSFGDIVWKNSEEHFLMGSDNLTLTLPDGTTESVDGYLEARYLEDGVVQLMDDTRQWQLVADGTTVRFSNGVVFDCSDKILKDEQGESRMTLQEMLLDADDNIRVQTAQEWVAPEFDFEVVDGQDGETGEAGQAGVSGESGRDGESGDDGELGSEGIAGEVGTDGGSGEDGDDGDAGSSGSDGANGANGANGDAGANGADRANGQDGASGATGQKGTLTEGSPQGQASFSVTDTAISAGSLEITFTVFDNDEVLTGEDVSIYVLDSAGNSLEWEARDGLSDIEDGKFTFENDGETEYTVYVPNLNPDSSYRLIVSAGYQVTGLGSGVKDYINRVFYTDSTGIFLEKTAATSDSLEIEVTAADYAKSVNGFSGIQVKLYKEGDRNNVLKTLDIAASDLDGTYTFTTDQMTSKSGLDDGLESNTSYVVTFDVVGSNFTTSTSTYTWKTLKETPTIGSPYAETTTQGYFLVGVKDVVDSDSAITGWRYDIVTGDSSQTKVYSMTSTQSSDVRIYMDQAGLEEKTTYYLYATAIYNNNETDVELKTKDYATMLMGESTTPYATFEKESVTCSTINGVLTINANGAKINIGEAESTALTLMIEGGSDYRATQTLTKSKVTTGDADTISVPVTFTGLKEDTTYTISAWGYVQEYDYSTGLTENRYQLLGACNVTTLEYEEVKLTIRSYDAGTKLGAMIYLGDEGTSTATLSETLKAIRGFRLKLYRGANATESMLVDQSSVVTLTEADLGLSGASGYDSQPGLIAGKYYGTGVGIEVTEATFNKSSSNITASQYTIAVSAILDYTMSGCYTYGTVGDENLSGYENVIPFAAGSTKQVTLNVTDSLPSLPNPLSGGVEATAVTYKELSALGITYTGDNESELEDDTIVGYHLASTYDNSSQRARSITYYAMTEADIVDYDSSDDKADYDDATLWRQAQGSSRETPYAQVTYPVSADSSTTPSVYIMFFKAPSGSESKVADLSGLTDKETENNTANSSGISEYYTSGKTPVFYGYNLKRGWHYVFAYKARLEYSSSTEFVYPNNWSLYFVSGETLLTSTIQDTPRQAAKAKMSLYKTEQTGTLSEGIQPGYVYWNYSLKDVDSTIQADSDALSCGLLATSGSTKNLISAGGTPPANEGWDGQAKVYCSTEKEYTLGAMELLYADKDVASSTSAAALSSMTNYAAAKYIYAYTNDQLLSGISAVLTLPQEGQGNTATIKLKYNNVASMKTRLARVYIRAFNSSGEEVSNSAQSYDSYSDSDEEIFRYDLSKAGSQGDKVSLQISARMDTGFGGMYHVENRKTGSHFAMATQGDEVYVNWRWQQSDTGAEQMGGWSSKNAFLSSYTVASSDPDTDAEEAEFAWSVHNDYSNVAVSDSYKDLNLNMKKTAYGDMYLANNKYPVFRETADCKYTAAYTDESGASIETFTIGDLSPSITTTSTKLGLSSYERVFQSNSYDMLSDETVTIDGEEKTGRFITAELWHYLENNTDKGLEGTATSIKYIEIENTGETAKYTYSVDGLDIGGVYCLRFYCLPSGTTDRELIYDNSGAKDAEYTVTLLSELGVTDFTLGDITYYTYQNKTMGITYKLDLTTGFDLDYAIQKMDSDGTWQTLEDTSLTDDDDMGTVHHQTAMKLLGYTWKDGYWYSASEAAFSIQSVMVETLYITPGSMITPGGTYRFVVSAGDATDETDTAGRGEVEFTIPAPTSPSFYMEASSTSSSSSETATMLISFYPVDPNKTIAGDISDDTEEDVYYVVVWNDDKTEVLQSGRYTCNSGTNVAVKTMTVSGLQKSTEYPVSFYANVDKTGAGMEALDLSNVEDLAAYLKKNESSLLIQTSTMKTLQSWGGAYDSVDMSFNSSNNIEIDVFNAQNINLVDEIYVSVTNSSVGTLTFTRSKADNADIFQDLGDNVYYTIVTTTLKDKGKYTITASFRKDGEELFRESKQALIK